MKGLLTIPMSDNARLASRAKFLESQARLRVAAAAMVYNEDIASLENQASAISAAQLAHLERERQTVDAVAQLQAVEALQTRHLGLGIQEEHDDEATARRVDALDAVINDELVEVARRVALQRGSDAGFTEVDSTYVQSRIAAGDFITEKTEEDRRAEELAQRRDQDMKLQEVRRSLPIFKYRDELIELIRRNQVVVIIGETGSGKTTQLLQYVYEAELHRRRAQGSDEEQEGILVCTQPRRIAAVSVAERVAKEMGHRCGGVVGYKVRFDDNTSESTRISFVTDGIMLKELLGDPDLSKFAAIMIDEAHERSLNSDILLGLLRSIIRRNKTIRVIIASATIQADKFCSFFGGAPKFRIEGRTFPVELMYATDAVPDYVGTAAEQALRIHTEKPLPGDILIFLPGQEDIENCANLLAEKAASLGGSIRELIIRPIYASLPPDEQKKIYQPTPPNCRKVVIATNIAETSITIDGVVYVIDSGLCKQDFYNPKTMMDELAVMPTSQASAEQRRGRAGRTQSGECLRLYTKFMFENMDKETKPEILRTSISSVVLQLKSLGVNNIVAFDFLDVPSPDAIQRSLEHLCLLGAIRASDGALTKTGFRMAEFPMDPSMSKMLLKSVQLGCARHVAMAAAMLSLDNSLFLPCRKAEEKRALEQRRLQLFGPGNGDVVGYVRIFEEWIRCGPRSREYERSNFLNGKSLRRAREIFDQILKTFDRWGMEYASADSVAQQGENGLCGLGIDVAAVTRSLITGYFPNIAVLGIDGESYTPVRPVAAANRNASTLVERVSASIHPSSFLSKAGQLTVPQDQLASMGMDRTEWLETLPPVLRERPHLVLYVNLRLTRQDAPPFMMHVTSVASDVDAIMECTPKNYFSRSELVAVGRIIKSRSL